MSTNEMVDTNANSLSKDEIKKFKEQINKTKFCRINAYKRCGMWDSFYKVIACIYNLIVIGLSILILIDIDVLESSQTLISAILIIAAVCTFALDLYLRVVNYGSKAEQYKSVYNELESILAELAEVEENFSSAKFIQLRQRYATLMKNSINHDEQDYFRYVYYNVDDQSDEMNESDKIYFRRIKNKYRWHKARDFLVKCGFSFTIYFVVWLLTLICAAILDTRDKRSRRKHGEAN